MNERFEPYRKWLGIPPEDQPPHHYRLLGIEPFEADPDVIASAADGRMAQVKNFQIGKYSQLSQRILNEIAAAKLCLLNPEKKELYDRKLRPRLEAEKEGIPKVPPPTAHKPGPKTDTTVEAGIPAIETSSVFSYVASRSPRRRSWPVPVALGAGAVVLVALAFVFFGGGNDLPVVQRPTSPAQSPRDLAPKTIPVNPPSKPDRQDGPPAAPETDRQPPPVNPTTPPDAVPPQADPGRPLADLLDPPDPGQSADPAAGPPGSERPARSQPSEDPTAAPERLPGPGVDAQQEAEKRIRDLFRKEFAAATTPEKKLALAQTLSKQAEETADDPTARFVLMRLACEMGAAAGELTATLELADRMRQLYGLDALTFKASLLEKVAETVQAGSPTSATNRNLVDAALLLVDEAVAADSLDLAGRLTKLALSAARKMQDPVLLRRLTARDREIDRLKVRFIAVNKALDVLAQNPDDGEANLTAGRWYCFTAGNWARGLPLLAKGTDAELAKLAKQDMAGPEDARQQMKLADLWGDLAQREKGPEQRGIQGRAGHWYESALPGLSGLDKAEAEKRLAAIAASAQPSEPRIRGIVQQGNVALASNGTSVTGQIRNPEKLIDGKREAVTDQDYAVELWPCEWIITFDKVYRLQEIYFRFVSERSWYYNYTIEVSADGKKYAPLVDRSQGQWNGWQGIPFTPRPVKAIKFNGTKVSGSQWLGVVEFEAYCVPPATPPQ